MPNRPITADERKHWSTLGHILALEAISEISEWTRTDYAFHGGTSLHLSWNSPRFSEDLNFLLSDACDRRLPKIMNRVISRIHENLLKIDHTLLISMTGKSRGRLAEYRFVLSKPGVLGGVTIKAEFWKVDPLYLMSYRSTSKTPAAPADMLGGYTLAVSPILPAGTLTAAYLDKLTAFATRPHLKWRDIFDFWWITNHAGFTPPDDIVSAFLQNLSAYSTVDELKPEEALRKFTTRFSREDMLAAAVKDLKPFLPAGMWNRFWPDTVAEMVDMTLTGVADVAELVAQHPDNIQAAPGPIGAPDGAPV
jgi:hypothetical protein